MLRIKSPRVLLVKILLSFSILYNIFKIIKINFTPIYYQNLKNKKIKKEEKNIKKTPPNCQPFAI
jgi:hypothetical protein